MPKTSGDELFERYLREHGYEPGSHEPSLAEHGIEKRPDFLPSRGERQIGCEVEQFTPGASALERRLADQRTVSASGKEVYGPIRRHVAKAAQQLKPLTALEMSLVVVLANPEGAMLDLSVQHVLSALYGNPMFTMEIDPTAGAAVGEGRFEFGRDGKLTNDHPYLSAVALLRRRERRVDRISEIAAEERAGRDPSDFDEATTEALELLQRLEREDLPDGENFGQIRDDRVYDLQGQYRGTIVGDRLIYRSTQSARVVGSKAQAASRAGSAQAHQVGSAAWGDEPNIEP